MNRQSLFTTRDSQSHDHPGVTELIVSGSAVERRLILLPMLAYLSRQSRDRWLTWIAPEIISKQLLREQGFDLGRLRLVHPHTREETLWLLWDALHNGNSATVAATLATPLQEKDLRSLEAAARAGNCRGLLLRNREALAIS